MQNPNHAEHFPRHQVAETLFLGMQIEHMDELIRDTITTFSSTPVYENDYWTIINHLGEYHIKGDQLTNRELQLVSLPEEVDIQGHTCTIMIIQADAISVDEETLGSITDTATHIIAIDRDTGKKTHHVIIEAQRALFTTRWFIPRFADTQQIVPWDTMKTLMDETETAIRSYIDALQEAGWS